MLRRFIQGMCRYRIEEDGRASVTFETSTGAITETADLVVAADGIHSAIRAQMYPDQPPIHWGGALMWRGTSWAKPVRTDSSFMGLGTYAHRMVIYPISHPDPKTGLSLINWIAEVTHDDPMPIKIWVGTAKHLWMTLFTVLKTGNMIGWICIGRGSGSYVR